ncbi:hypothetical protein BGZ73_000945, partial [Actinomortierella ambigua]
MRFISAAAIVASLTALVSAQSAHFPFAPEGACVAACTDSTGKSFFAEYNDVDEYGENFIKSLSYTFERGTPTTIQFMTLAGTCMSSCPMPEQDLYRQQYPGKLNWYKANKFLPPPP